MKTSFPEVVRTTRIIRTWSLISTETFNAEQTLVETDPDFLQMFDFPLIAGDPETALDGVDRVLITQEMADRYFGDSFKHYGEVVGRTLTFHGSKPNDDYVVSGVFDDLPLAKTLWFDVVIRYENGPKFGGNSHWGSSNSTYVELDRTESSAALDSKLISFSHDWVEPYKEKYTGRRWADRPEVFKLFLQPITEIHFRTDINPSLSSYESVTSPTMVYVLIGGGFVVLAIACINFTSLAISRSATRTLEVGMRKSMGARKGQIIGQFWGEALVLVSLAIVLGAVLAELFLPVFSSTIGDKLSLLDIGLATLAADAVALLLLIGILGGTYPAYVVSNFQPTDAIRGLSKGLQKRRLNAILLTLQYALSVMLLISTTVMTNQVDFLRRFDLGYDAEQVLLVKLRGGDSRSLGERFKQLALNTSGVVSVSLTDRAFPYNTSTTEFRRPGSEQFEAFQYKVDPDFLETMGLSLVAGQNFKADLSDATGSVIVNERFAELYGVEDLIGESVPYTTYGLKDPIVVGILCDFHFRSAREHISPAIFVATPEKGRVKWAIVRLASPDLPEVVGALGVAWKETGSGLPFECSFYDDHFNEVYQDDELWSRLLGWVSFIAIGIACMGLFGQAAIAVARRTKEIGIRKVLGATGSQIVSLLSRDLVKLVVAANVLAWPAAWYFMDQWLMEFAYRIDLSPLLFVFAGGGALLIGAVTVAYLGVRAACSDPVDALRYE